MLKQLLVDGFFHGDPHPGNVLVNLESGVVIFLDLGMMGTLTREQRMDLIDLLWSINAQDSYELASVLLRLSTPFKEVDEAQFRRGVDRLVAQFMLYNEQSNTVNGVMTAALGLMYTSGLRLQNDLTIAIKALGQLEEIVTTLNKEIYLVDVAMDEVRRLLVEEFSVDNVTDQLKQQAVRSGKEVIRRIPSLQQATMKWLDQYEQGQFTVTLDTGDLTKQVSNFSSGLQLLTVGLILVGMMLASALAVWITSSAGIENLTSTAFYIFVATLLLGTYMVFRLLAGLRKQNK
jgi:ubiquinone biosynthesis protein